MSANVHFRAARRPAGRAGDAAHPPKMMRMIRRLFIACLAVSLGTASLGTLARAQNEPVAAATPAPHAASTLAPSPAPAPTLAPTPPSEPSGAPQGGAAPATSPRPAVSGLPFPFGTGVQTQSYATFTKTATMQPGVIDLIRKDEELYFDLKPENFDKTYIVLPSIERGVGSGAFAGRVYEPFQVTFKLVGKRVLWITPNTRYVADKGSAAANSLAISVADSVILSTPVVAEDPAKKHIVVAPSLFLTDFEGIGAELGRGATPPSLPGLLLLVARPSFSVDATKSYYRSTKAFPSNDEISVNLAFNGPANALPTVPDGRGIPIGVHYSVVAPPERDPKFVPRLADDRVGYFITARKRYGNDTAASPFERFIERWNLDGGPITFYLTNEIPKEYRGTVRRGILAWNEAFAKIGRPNAIVVKDPPPDPSWDPDDARYTTVRWITSDQPDFSAYSPHVSDPDTGQIIRAEVVIDGESLRSIKRGYVERVQPAQRARANAYGLPGDRLGLGGTAAEDTAGDEQSFECSLEEDSVAQAALGSLLLARNPRATQADRERYAQEWLYSTVLHEVGHTLGLRHNFAGSTSYSYAQLHDPSFTRAHGTTASVMDYTPANVAAPRERQADYFPTKLGTYDEWAIEYGYRAFPNVRSSADEAVPLARIAARSTEPGHAYGTDEDATLISIDPRIQRFDLSSDPLKYVDEQFRIDDDVASHLTRSYPGDARSFSDIGADHGAEQPAQQRRAGLEVRRRDLHLARAPRPARRDAAVPVDPARAAAPRLRAARPLGALVERVPLLTRAAQRGGADALRHPLGRQRRAAQRLPGPRGDRRAAGRRHQRPVLAGEPRPRRRPGAEGPQTRRHHDAGRPVHLDQRGGLRRSRPRLDRRAAPRAAAALRRPADADHAVAGRVRRPAQPAARDAGAGALQPHSPGVAARPGSRGGARRRHARAPGRPARPRQRGPQSAEHPKRLTARAVR